MSPAHASPRLAFVSAPGGSAFMEEILAAVADAVTAAGIGCAVHRGFISDVAETGTRFVVVPHEYLVLAPEEPPELYARTVGFGVEHPGTGTFTTAAAATRRLGARFEISLEAVRELSAGGVTAEHFPFGYVDRWDRWRGAGGDRPVDVLYMGTADDRRLRLLSRIADDLDDLTCELLIPPHEPMTRERPDFLLADRKWELLARSKVLINLHREDKMGFEWIRGVEAMANGCLVVTEPSTELEPLVPGEHLLVSDVDRIGAVARAAATNEALRRRITYSAYQLCRSALRMDRSVRRLIDVAMALDAPPTVLPRSGVAPSPPAAPGDDAPLAVWIPEVTRLPHPDGPPAGWTVPELAELARLRSTRATLTRGGAAVRRNAPVDVVCVSRPGDGPLGATLDSLEGDADLAAVQVAGCLGSLPLGAEGAVAGYLAADLPLGRGAARNLLLESTGADLVCVLDSGDEVRPGALRRLVTMIAGDPDLDVVFAMATHGPGCMVNVLVPERRRMSDRIYLTRGFVARRRLIERIGGFSEDPMVEGFVDHVFWRDSLAAGASIRLARWIGFSLWPQAPGRLLADLDPSGARAAILGAGCGSGHR